jgi:hypothetical protein
VVDLFFADDGPQGGEVSASGGLLILNVFPLTSGSTLSLPVEELLEVLRLAQQRLSCDA